MKTFVWSNSFVTGQDSVDEQHLTLVDRLNRFGECISEGEMTADRMEALLASLVEYAVVHFQDEERLMHDSGIDPRHLRMHKRAHADFTDEVGQLMKDVSRDNIAAAQSLHRFLMHWLAYHILVVDQNMARQIDMISAGADARQAYDGQEVEAEKSTGPLLSALNGLFEEVSKRNRELAELNRTLEQKVAARTQALAEANQHLEELSLTDTLTELPNRRYAMQKLKMLWSETHASGQPLSCVMIDADHFKAVNDTYGHDKGDLVLQELSKTLLHTFRNDDVVCRLGGDEFFVICPATDHPGAMLVAEKVRSIVAEMRVATGGEPWVGSVSMGVATRTPVMNDVEALIKQADKGVYAAKQAGKNCVRSV